MKVLITLGPTREPIDPVRFISNASSGKMGAAIAKCAIERGHEVTIVAGPVSVGLPGGAKVHRVNTAREMVSCTLRELREGFDVMICTAAIADYSPVSMEPEKIRSGLDELTLTLVKNPKLTLESRGSFPDLYIVAFKAEHGVSKEDLAEIAYSKLVSEDLDLIVANDVSGDVFGSDFNQVLIIERGGKSTAVERESKENISRKLWEKIERSIEERLHK